MRLALALLAAAAEVVEIEGVDEVPERGREALRLAASSADRLATLAGRARLDLLPFGVELNAGLVEHGVLGVDRRLHADRERDCVARPRVDLDVLGLDVDVDARGG